MAIHWWRRLLWWRRGPLVTRHPVVLLHGAFGFEQVVVNQTRRAYFQGVRERLLKHGVELHAPVVAPVAGIERRAVELVAQLDAVGPGRLNLVAHSMGGLDARYAITHLGLSQRIASLITIGTPHHGTPLADAGLRLSQRLRLRHVLGAGSDLLGDLSTGGMEAFNQRVPDAPGVFYASIVGRVPPSGEVHPLLRPTHALLSRRVGLNDGVVPASSQPWGEVLWIVDADHWAQVGWSGSSDSTALYEAIVRELRARGF
ncbi:MAG TPA: hypothetical protein ENK18_15950 [Deltaproteobacteria bacterium]|nr:hypothetical protein [Deltaproteobacteria bacterium]